jgi:phospholipid/cholesterol/gamma-HCH transport system permease protein
VESGGDHARLILSGSWKLAGGVPATTEAASRIRALGKHAVRVDVAAVESWDSTLPAFLTGLSESAGGSRLDFDGLPEDLAKLLALAHAQPGQAPPAAAGHRSLLRRLGEAATVKFQATAAFCALLGEVLLAGPRLLAGRAKFYREDVWTVIQNCSADALPIVSVVNLLVGAIMAFVAAVQLASFGAGMLVADGVAIAEVREMAAVITAVVLSGRTGAAFAAQLATMQGNEEIDALATMGVRAEEYLVLPRVLALSVMTPLLYLYGCAVGILGGMAVSTAMMDVSARLYYERTLGALTTTNFVLGGVKSVLFGALVALFGCHYGLRAERNAAAVGRATTSAVVAGIVGVIAVDAVIAVCAHALGL